MSRNVGTTLKWVVCPKSLETSGLTVGNSRSNGHTKTIKILIQTTIKTPSLSDRSQVSTTYFGHRLQISHTFDPGETTRTNDDDHGRDQFILPRSVQCHWLASQLVFQKPPNNDATAHKVVNRVSGFRWPWTCWPHGSKRWKIKLSSCVGLIYFYQLACDTAIQDPGTSECTYLCEPQVLSGPGVLDFGTPSSGSL